MYKKLTISIIILVASVLATAYFVYNAQYNLLLIAVPIIVFSIYRIFSVSTDYMRKVSFMFNAIDCDDYSFMFTESASDANRTMFNSSLNRIKEIMTNAKIRAVEREKYYELIMNSVKTGIITINNNGNVFQVNNEAKRMFGLEVFTHINQLQNIDVALVEALRAIKSDERKKISYRNERGEVFLAISASGMEYDGKQLRIIAVNDINNELDEKEVESWIKLTRVLTHEIMNSLAPITSLSDTLMNINTDQNKSVTQGLQTINTTAKSLISFVDSYRKFTRLQTPVCSPFSVKQMLERTTSLVCGSQVNFNLSVTPDDMLVYADENLITQVVVNLVKNAVQAVADAPVKRIDISANIEPDESITMKFSNSGSAIPAEIADDIFMPFFTTKPDGSGIGLSIAKQIMHIHGGAIRLTSNIDQNVEFTLQFA